MLSQRSVFKNNYYKDMQMIKLIVNITLYQRDIFSIILEQSNFPLYRSYLIAPKFDCLGRDRNIYIYIYIYIYIRNTFARLTYFAEFLINSMGAMLIDKLVIYLFL